MQLLEECELIDLAPDNLIVEFDCGNEDLNEFFNRDALLYQNQILGQTYFFRHKALRKTVCAFSLSPDGFKMAYLPNSRRKKVKEHIPHEKPLQSYPAFLIGRLGVSSEFNGQGIGSQLIEFIKYLCSVKYSHLCRFLLVDAYNEPDVLKFYQKNDFQFVFSTEDQEREYYKKTISSEPLRTRFMFYDMIFWRNETVSKSH